ALAGISTGPDSARPFILPLDVEEPEAGASPGRGTPGPLGLQRWVTTDDDGRFHLPPVAAGRYLLEGELPNGVVHRGDPFDLPSARTVRQQLGPDARRTEVGARLSWDVGDIEVQLGLGLEVWVQDPFGEPIAGAFVQGRQGDTPESLRVFRLEAGPEGRARLSGLSAEMPLHLACTAPGYTARATRFELVPVVHECVLAPLARIRGSVVGLAGAPPPGAGLVLEAIAPSPLLDPPADSEDSGTTLPPPRQTLLGLDGTFRFSDLEPGSYRLTVAAPGHEAVAVDAELAMGQTLDLGTLVLPPGRPLEGRVVDAETGEPIPGAEIFSIDPPGAAATLADRDGEFEVAAIGESHLLLEVKAPGYAAARPRLSPAAQRSSDPLVVELSQGGWIRVLVGGERNPCVGCAVRISPGRLELETDTRGEALSETLAKGWYEVVLPRRQHVGTVVVERPRAESRWVRVEPEEITTARFDTERPPLEIRFDRALPPRARLSARTLTRTETVELSVDGIFRIRRLPGERLELFLHTWDPAAGAETRVRQGMVPAGFEGDELVLSLSGSRVVGRLRTWGASGIGAPSGDAPAAGIRLRLIDLHHRGFPAPEPLGIDRGFLSAEARSRADGSFEIEHLPAGVYNLIVGDRTLQVVSVSERRTVDLGTFQLVPGSY
ncbi:MAG: carboxypeptidase-like regulatory domain-containing protein, partial [Holophagales bacterium]|nr:carboxypeptidase-like regulatory domain-containing protein [Holophagales bacterium]